MRNIIKKIDIKRIIICYTILQPIIDLFTSLSVRYNIPGVTIGVIIKGLFLGFLSLFCILKYKFKDRKVSTIFLILYIIYEAFFAIITCLNKSYIIVPSEIKSSIKAFFAPVLLAVMYDIFKNEKANIKSRYFSYVLIEYSLLILLANLTGTSFNTYLGGKQGSIGWFYAGNDIGAILISLFPIFYFNIIKTNSKILILLLFVIIYILFSIGTKVPILGVILILMSFMFLTFINKKFVRNNFKKKINIKLLIILTTFVAILLPTSSFLDNIKYQNEIINTNKTDIKEEDSSNVSDLIFSGRDEFKNATKKRYEVSPIYTKIFGMGYYSNTAEEYKLIEMDIEDLFYNHGIAGSLLYFSIYIYIIILILKQIIKKNLGQVLTLNIVSYLVSIVLLCGIGFYSGHVFLNPTVSYYLILYIITLLFKLYNCGENKKIIDNNKITIMALHLKYGGIEKFISTISTFLSKKYDIEIVSTYKFSEVEQVSIPKNVKIKYLLADKYHPNKVEIKECLKNKKYVSLFYQLIYAFKVVILKNIKMAQYIKKCDSHIIISTRIEHNRILSEYGRDDVYKIATEHNYYSKKYSTKVVNSCDYIDAFIVSTNDQKKYYENLFDNRKTKVYKIPIALNYIPKDNSKLTKYNLISIGRLSKEKGFDELIDIFNNLIKIDSKYSLKIIGDGDQKEFLQEKINNLNLGSKIKLCGRKNNDEIIKLLLNSSIYLMTSYTESFGIVLIEALSCGVPSIIFDDAKGAVEIISNDYNGIIIKNRNQKKYVDSILKLTTDNKYLKQLSNNAKKTSNKYSIETIEKEWLKLFDEEAL